MINQDVKRWLANGLFKALLSLSLLALLPVTPAHAITPASWKETGFSMNANGMRLREVFEEFGRTYGVRVSYSLKGDEMARGRVKGDTGFDFLDRLGQAHKFRWFVYNDVLYVVPTDDNVSLRLEVGEDSVQDAKSALTGIGLFESRFGWGELPDEGVVIVTGPRAYVELARDILLPVEKKTRANGRQIMVFRLKYASASDRLITTRGQTETIPGVKTILNNLLYGGSPGPQLADGRRPPDMGSSKRSRSAKRGRAGATEVFSDRAGRKSGRDQDDDDQDSAPARSKAPESSREERPRIEADPTLNAIMIYDFANKREVYESLIKELDIEPKQVEIEALIVDIDRSKLSEMGVEWGVTRGGTTTTVNGTKGDSQGIDLPLPGSTLMITNAARFYARLKALEGNGQAHVLAKPTVLTLDNVAAVLDLSQTSYVPLVGERVADLADVSAGTKLRVVPRILNEGDQTKVRLEIDIEDGALSDPSLKSAVTRSTISTQAIIGMQQTLMIGGYHAESLTKDKQKVPVLGDAPLVGGLFRSEAEKYSNRERLFLITPRLSGNAGVAASARSRAGTSARRLLGAPEQDEAAPAAKPEAKKAEAQAQAETQAETRAELQAPAQKPVDEKKQAQPEAQVQVQQQKQVQPQVQAKEQEQKPAQAQAQPQVPAPVPAPAPVSAKAPVEAAVKPAEKLPAQASVTPVVPAAPPAEVQAGALKMDTSFGAPAPTPTAPRKTKCARPKAIALSTLF